MMLDFFPYVGAGLFGMFQGLMVPVATLMLHHFRLDHGRNIRCPHDVGAGQSCMSPIAGNELPIIPDPSALMDSALSAPTRPLA